MAQPKYATLSLPDEIVQEIDIIVAERRLGYRSRAEFVMEAVRKLLVQVKAASPPSRSEPRRDGVELDDQGLPRPKYRP